jgi:hypothetical protein
VKRFAFDFVAALAVGVILMLSMGGCGSTYTLKKGGWSIDKDAEKGTCLTVHGDGDPEVVVVCILSADPVKLPKSVLEASCPKCPEPPAAAEEKANGSD